MSNNDLGVSFSASASDLRRAVESISALGISIGDLAKSLGTIRVISPAEGVMIENDLIEDLRKTAFLFGLDDEGTEKLIDDFWAVPPWMRKDFVDNFRRIAANGMQQD